jgi:hypothetical protein
MITAVIAVWKWWFHDVDPAITSVSTPRSPLPKFKPRWPKSKRPIPPNPDNKPSDRFPSIDQTLDEPPSKSTDEERWTSTTEVVIERIEEHRRGSIESVESSSRREIESDRRGSHHRHGRRRSGSTSCYSDSSCSCSISREASPDF